MHRLSLLQGATTFGAAVFRSAYGGSEERFLSEPPDRPTLTEVARRSGCSQEEVRRCVEWVLGRDLDGFLARILPTGPDADTLPRVPVPFLLGACMAVARDVDARQLWDPLARLLARSVAGLSPADLAEWGRGALHVFTARQVADPLEARDASRARLLEALARIRVEREAGFDQAARLGQTARTMVGRLAQPVLQVMAAGLRTYRGRLSGATVRAMVERAREAAPGGGSGRKEGHVRRGDEATANRVVATLESLRSHLALRGLAVRFVLVPASLPLPPPGGAPSAATARPVRGDVGGFQAWWAEARRAAAALAAHLTPALREILLVPL